MPEPIAVFFADSHLADRAWASRDIEGDAYYSFDQIINFAVERALPVFAAGDLIDRAINRSSPITRAYQALDRLQRAGLPFNFVQGQHDASDPPWFSGHPAARHLHNETDVVGNGRCGHERVAVFGLDFTPAPLLQVALTTIPPGTGVLLAHQVWSLWMGDVANPQGGPHDVPVVPTVFTGDYHVYQVTDTRGRDGQPLRFVSSGSTHMLSIDEPVDKSFSLLMDDGSWKRVKLKTRRRIDYAVAHPGDVDVLLETLDARIQQAMDATVGFDERVRKPLIWVDYPYALAEHRPRIERAVNGRCHMFWRERPPEPPPEVAARQQALESDGDGRARGRAATLAGELPAYLAANNLGHARDDCVRLLDAQDVAGELRRMREEALS